MKESTCCFTGHRVISPENLPHIEAALKREITSLIHSGVNTFWAGGALGYDTLAAETVLSMKKDYSELKLMIAVPCRHQSEKWSAAARIKYDTILDKCDGYVILSEEYYNGCMQMRNRFMVDNSAFCIAYMKEDYGGTAYTVRYAEKKGVNIIKLFGNRHGEQLKLPF